MTLLLDYLTTGKILDTLDDHTSGLFDNLSFIVQLSNTVKRILAIVMSIIFGP